MTGAASRSGGDWVVRDATAEDAAGCAAVYAPYVLSTAVSFELEPPDESARIVGYAYAGGRAQARRVA